MRITHCGILIASLALSGCEPATEPDDPASDDDVTVDDVTIEVTGELGEVISTVVFVHVEVDDADAVVVRYRTDDAPERSVSATGDGGGSWTATLLGLGQQREVTFDAVVERDGETWTSAEGEILTGTLLPGLPEPSVDLLQPDAMSPGFVITAVSWGPSAAAVILDSNGEYVWAYELGEAYKLTHAWLSVDRQWVFALASGPDPEGIVVTRIRIDGTSVEEIGLVGDWHHDATSRPDGTVDLLVYDERLVDEVPYTGDQIVSLSPAGDLESVWSIWDHRTPPEGQSEGDQDWSHANVIVSDDVEDAWYLSLFSLDEIVKIDRASGEILWTFGGAASDFQLPAGTQEGFHHQHGFEVLDDGLVLFDNGDPEQYASRVEEYALDMDAGTAALVWEYEPEPSLYNLVLGDVERLDDGNTLVCFSNAGQLDLVDPEGVLVWQLSMPMPSTFWYLQAVPTLYP